MCNVTKSRKNTFAARTHIAVLHDVKWLKSSQINTELCRMLVRHFFLINNILLKKKKRALMNKWS